MTALTDLRADVAVGVWPGDVVVSTLIDHATTSQAYKAFSGSLDAAKSLHEAVLPGWEWRIRGDGRAWVWRTASDLCGGDEVDDNPARAWLLALLDALIAKEADQ